MAGRWGLVLALLVMTACTTGEQSAPPVGSSTSSTSVAEPPRAARCDATIADLDGDGHQDMVGRTDSDTTLLICGSRGHEARIRTPGYEHSRVVDLDGDGSAEIIDGGTGVWSRSGFVIDWDGDSFSLIDWPDSTLRWEGITPLALTDGFDPDPDAADRKVLDWDCLPDEPEADLWISRIAVSESGPEEFEWFLRLDEGRAVTINKLHGSVPSDVPATADELAAGRSCAAFE